jgi:MFS family permease
MPVTQSQPIWFGLRLIAGVASALVFVIAVSALLDNLHGAAQHLVGWAFGGIGAGIALSGLLVLVLRTVGSWRTGWWASAALAALLTVLAWRLAPEPASAKAGPGRMSERPTTHRWFVTLLTGYTLEGVGYIIAGTFLVAAIGQTSPGWLGSGAWVLVGLAAVPASAFWAALSRRWSRPTLLIVMLFVQAVGIALPALSGGAAAALVSAVLFGATFLGVASLVLAVGAHLRFPHAVALLTTGYSLGQIAGPLLVSPLLHNGYRLPLLIAAAIVAAATVAAAALRVRFPHRVGPMVEPSRQARS